jgi:hypothetical protein
MIFNNIAIIETSSKNSHPTGSFKVPLINGLPISAYYLFMSMAILQ